MKSSSVSSSWNWWKVLSVRKLSPSQIVPTRPDLKFCKSQGGRRWNVSDLSPRRLGPDVAPINQDLAPTSRRITPDLSLLSHDLSRLAPICADLAPTCAAKPRFITICPGLTPTYADITPTYADLTSIYIYKRHNNNFLVFCLESLALFGVIFILQ